MTFRYPQRFITQLLDNQNIGTAYHQLASTNGDGTGDTQMTGNYLTPTDFYFAPEQDELFVMLHVCWIISVSAKPRLCDFGSIGELTNGIQIIGERDGDQFPINPGGAPVTCNRTLFHLTCAGPHITELQDANELMQINIDFSHRPNQYAKFFGPTGDKLIFRLHDDFEDLDEHAVVAHGFRKFLVEG